DDPVAFRLLDHFLNLNRLVNRTLLQALLDDGLDHGIPAEKADLEGVEPARCESPLDFLRDEPDVPPGTVALPLHRLLPLVPHPADVAPGIQPLVGDVPNLLLLSFVGGVDGPRRGVDRAPPERRCTERAGVVAVRAQPVAR